MAYIFPAMPATPSVVSTWQEWDIYLRAVEANNFAEAGAAKAQHAQAQADTATAMRETADAMVASANAAAAPIKPSRAELAIRWFDKEPVTLDDTVSSIMARVMKQVDAFAKAYPGALRD